MIEVKNITKKIRNQIILDDFSLHLSEKDFIVVTGHSGVGKTTLINLLGLLDKVDSGEIYYFGKKVTHLKQVQKLRREIIGFVFQDHLLLGEKSVKENLSLALRYARKYTDATLLLQLEKLGLKHIALKERVSCLSGGEQQRLALARTLLKENKVIFADEPTGSLDKESADLIIANLYAFSQEKNHAVVLVTHDLSYLKFATKHIEL